MQRHLSLLAAASIAVGGACFAQYGQQERDTQRDQIQVDVDRDRDRVGVQADRDRDQGRVGIDADRDRVGIQRDRLAAEPRLPMGVEKVDEADKDGIKEALTRTTEKALDAEQFEELKDQFSSADQERLRELQADQQLQQQLSQFQQAYQQRYDKDFEIATEQLEGQVQIAQGEVTSPAMLIRWPVEATDEPTPRLEQDRPFQPGQPGAQPGQPGAQPGAQPGQQPGIDQPQPGAMGEPQPQPGHVPGRTGAEQQDGFGQPGAAQQDRIGQPGTAQPGAQDRIGQPGAAQRQPGIGIDRADIARHELEEGDKVAVVAFRKHEELPEVTVSLVEEDGQWKLDLPQHVDARTIQQNLGQNLQKLSQKQEQWPQDAEQFSAKLTHVVMLSLYDVDMERDRMHRPMDGQQFDRPQPGQQQQDRIDIGT